MFDKIEKIRDLLTNANDPVFLQFFDIESEKMLDEKIEVLEALVTGQAPAQIEKYYNVLELMPKEGIWD